MINLMEELLHSPALVYAYPLYKDMIDNNIVFIYNGPVSSDLVVDVLALVEEKMEESHEDKRVSRKVFNIMVECMTHLGAENIDSNAVLLIRKMPYMYTITMGHIIATKEVFNTKNFLDYINMLPKPELRGVYHRLLSQHPTAPESFVGGLPALSIVDLARKAGGYLQYEFNYITEEKTFFSLEARIQKNKTF
ncbi:MAG: SiaB family protein kinase [Bacteroidia bacterium]